MEEDAKPPIRRFGIAREARKSGEPLNVTENTTVWEIYNHKATKADREMIKDWNDSLNTLIIFVSCNKPLPVSVAINTYVYFTGCVVLGSVDAVHYREHEAS
jgi:hypothetical protein